jgi:hypothetical protein
VAFCSQFTTGLGVTFRPVFLPPGVFQAKLELRVIDVLAVLVTGQREDLLDQRFKGHLVRLGRPPAERDRNACPDSRGKLVFPASRGFGARRREGKLQEGPKGKATQEDRTISDADLNISQVGIEGISFETRWLAGKGYLQPQQGNSPIQ